MNGHGRRSRAARGSALLAALVAAGATLPLTTSANTARLQPGAPVALRSCAYAKAYPAWFQPVAAYYGCKPAITPDFDFASLFSPTAFR